MTKNISMVVNENDSKITPLQYIEMLLCNNLYEDAIWFLAHALPKRGVIWWSCVCARDAIKSLDSSPNELASFIISEKWGYEPTEDIRRVCGELAKQSEYQTITRSIAAAVFWSGGSIAALNEFAIEASAFLYSQALACSIFVGVALSNVGELDKSLEEIINKGLGIGDRGNGAHGNTHSLWVKD